MIKTFDSIKYDQISINLQEIAKEKCESLEKMINTLGNGREQAVAKTKLEECFAWIEKAIRNDQITRTSKSSHVHHPR